MCAPLAANRRAQRAGDDAQRVGERRHIASTADAAEGARYMQNANALPLAVGGGVIVDANRAWARGHWAHRGQKRQQGEEKYIYLISTVMSAPRQSSEEVHAHNDQEVRRRQGAERPEDGRTNEGKRSAPSSDAETSSSFQNASAHTQSVCAVSTWRHRHVDAAPTHSHTRTVVSYEPLGGRSGGASDWESSGPSEMKRDREQQDIREDERERDRVQTKSKQLAHVVCSSIAHAMTRRLSLSL